MTDKEKIKKYLKHKNYSKNSFYLKTGFSSSFLDSGKSLGVDKLRIIANLYEDLNIRWMVTNEGEMLFSKKTKEEEEGRKYIIKEQREIILQQKLMINNLQKNS